MSVRAKFLCQTVAVSKSQETDDGSTTVTLHAVGDENKTWSKWTPAGQLTMTINNPDAAKQFVAGRKYFLDITEAEPA